MTSGRGQGPEDVGPGADQVTLSGSRAAEDHPEDPARYVLDGYCWYQACMWPRGCEAEDKCIGRTIS